MELTKDWQPFIPSEGYQKEMQDVMLDNGDIIIMCWPNAGFWNVCVKEGNDQQYHNASIPCERATHTRLTHHKRWNT